LIKENILEYKCFICNINEWVNKTLILHLDHINGNNTDNRIENLRLLCPNCHSQTDTYCGKNIAKNKLIIKNKCLECGVQLNELSSKICKKCYNDHRSKYQSIKTKTKINWVSNDELAKLVFEYPATELAKQWGVSDRAIIKRCKKFNINVPGLGYWAKKKANKL